MINDKVRDAVLKRIDRDEVVDLALTLGAIDSPQGAESPAGSYIYDWLIRHGFQARKIGMFPERFNVMGVLPGTGHGQSLLFNSHMDTVVIRPHEKGPKGEIAWREGDGLFGWGVVNDKGPLATFLLAAKAIKEAGVKLPGDLVVTGVVGETGPEPVDEFQPPAFVSKDIGARFLATHGGVADYAIVAETSGFKVGWVEAGKAFFKITVRAQVRLGYTPYIKRPAPPGEQSNAAVLGAGLIQRLEEWGVEYERKHTYRCPGGVVSPTINIGALRAGSPPNMVRPPYEFLLYLECRIAPNQDPLAIREELRDMLAEMSIPGDVELYLYRRGYEAQGIEPLVERLGRAHRYEFGRDLEVADSVFCSMWRDHNVFNEMGIRALCYGPSEGVGGGNLRMPIADLVSAARVYALAALEVCSTPK